MDSSNGASRGVLMKAYLVAPNKSEPTEVRRFTIDHDVSTNFSYLQGKLRSTFSQLKYRNFRVTWQDSEGDNIVISNDAELMEALLEHSGRSESSSTGIQVPFKLQAAVIPGSRANGGEDAHGNAFHGFWRRPQAQFEDREQGASSSTQRDNDTRTQHGPKAGAWPGCSWMGPGFQPWTSSSGPSTQEGPCGPPRCGASNPSQPSATAGSESASAAAPDLMGLFSGLGAFLPMLDQFVNMTQQLSGFQTPEQGQQQATSEGKEKSKEAKSESSSDAPVDDILIDQLCSLLQDQLGIAPGNTDQFKIEVRNFVNANPMLRHIMSQIGVLGIPATFLNMFMQNMRPQTETGRCQENCQRSTCGKSGCCGGQTCGTSDSAQSAPGETSQTTSDRLNKKQEKSSEKIVMDVDVDDDNAAMGNQMNPSPGAAAVASDWTMVDNGEVLSGQQTETGTGARPKVRTVPINLEQPQQEQAASGQSGRGNLYPNIGEDKAANRNEEAPLRHPDEKINRALEIMSDMGFSNDGGWLTNLLESKHGDIAEVLDILRPHKVSQK